METIIVQVPIDSVVPNALDFLDDLNNKIFKDDNDLYNFLAENYGSGWMSDISLWGNITEFCSRLNFDELNREDYYYGAAKIEN